MSTEGNIRRRYIDARTDSKAIVNRFRCDDRVVATMQRTTFRWTVGPVQGPRFKRTAGVLILDTAHGATLADVEALMDSSYEKVVDVTFLESHIARLRSGGATA